MLPRFPLLISLALFLFWEPNLTQAGEPVSSEKRATELVRKLGDEEYQERSRAMELLRQMGLQAKKALQDGMVDPDPEIVWRCRELLPQVLDLDLQNRITAFRLDTEGKLNHDLPLWKLFTQVAGNGPRARQLYLEMLDREILQFLNDCSDHPNDQASQVDRYCHQLQLQMANQPGAFRPGAPISRAQIAAALLVGAGHNGQQQSSFVLVNSIYQTQIRATLQDPADSESFKKILLNWMNGQTNEQVILNLCHTIQNINLKESNEFICNVIREKKIRGVYLAQIMPILARQGKKENIKVLATLLDDKTVLGVVQLNQTKGNTELRDVALSFILQILGKSHKDYGFSFLSINPALVWSPHYAGFTDNTLREAAHKKWKEQPEARELK